MVHSILLATLWAVLSCSVVAAQGRPQTEPLRGRGTLKDMRPGYLQVEDEEKELWVLQVPDKPENISVQGAADASWLQRGMAVRFTALFDRNGQAQQIVKDLEVFTPRQADDLGVFPESNLNRLNLFKDDEQRQQVDPNIAPYRVAGQLVGFKNNVLTIQAGRTPVRVEVAETLKVSFDITDYRIAQPGDVVQYDGYYLPGQPGRGVVNRLTIVAKETRTGRKPDARKSDKDATTTDEGKKDEVKKDDGDQ